MVPGVLFPCLLSFKWKVSHRPPQCLSLLDQLVGSVAIRRLCVGHKGVSLCASPGFFMHLAGIVGWLCARISDCFDLSETGFFYSDSKVHVLDIKKCL